MTLSAVVACRSIAAFCLSASQLIYANSTAHQTGSVFSSIYIYFPTNSLNLIMSQRLALRVSSQLVARGASTSRAAAAHRACSSLSAAPSASTRNSLVSGRYAFAGRRRMISSTTVLWEDAKAAEAGAAPAEDEAPKGPSPFEKEVEAASTPGDEVPEWQNPRHHNNPEKDRVFAEEFGPDEEMPEVPLPPFDDGSGKVMASPELHAIAEEIVHMNMIEVNELCQRIAEHFGIEEQAGPPMMMAGAGGDGAAGEEEAAVEEKTAFDLKLVSFDAKAKIKVIKEVRGMAGLGLKEAKELVEGAPKTVMKEIKKEEAEELAKKLEELGAVCEIV